MATQLGEAVVQVRATLDKLDQDLAGARKKVDGVLGGVGIGISTAVATKSIELLEDGMRLAVDTMADGVAMATDLEAQLSGIAAVSGASAVEMENLSGLISDLGIDPKLKVSTFEAADAIEMLARNGLAVQDILDGAARSTVQLANATGSDFAIAADISTDAMALFGIEATEMGDAVDGITSVVTNSKFDIEDYALALAQGGGVAASVGVEFDDFNTTIAGIAPLFASGSDAGTSFKTMLQRLVPSTNPAKEAMAELGLLFVDTTEAVQFLTDKGFAPADSSLEAITDSFKKFGKEADLSKSELQTLMDSMVSQQNVFFDAQGNMKGMADIAGSMQTAFAGLSEEQRSQALTTIFGTDAMRAAVGLMELGGQGFADLQNKMSQTSGADAAAERMNNLAGATEILNGVVEGLQIQYGQHLIPKLTEMAQKAAEFASDKGPAMVDALADMSLAVLEFGEMEMPFIFKELSDVIGGIGDNLEKLNTAAQKTMELFGSSSEEAEKFNLASQALHTVLGALTQPIDLVNAVLGFMLDNLNTAIDEVTALKDSIVGLGDNTRTLTDRISDLGAALGDMVIPDWLKPGSPTPLEIGIRGISQAVWQMPDFASRFDTGTPAFPALAGAGAGASGGGSHITNIYIDGIHAGGGSGGSVDEALGEAFDVLRQRIKGKR